VRHLWFIAAAYALGTLVPLTYAVLAWQRARSASRRLTAVDTGRRA
jgi:cytochrome c biogenesis protein CcdA